jgi:ABC-2 type transport system permease protein
MSGSLVREVALREVRTRSRTRAFRLITAFLVVAAVAGPIIAALWPDDSHERRDVTIGLVDVDPAMRQEILADSGTNLDVTLRDLSESSPEQVEELIGDGEIDVALEPGPTLFWDEEADPEIASVLHGALQRTEALTRGQALGLDDEATAGLFTPVAIAERFVDQAEEPDDVATAVAFAGLMAAFMLPQVFGQLTMLSVVEEKSTGVVEVLLGHLRPRTLLMGKVLGLGALAVAQLMVAVGGLVATLLLTNTVDIPASVWRFMPILVVSILGGLAIYNTFFALLGSLISRQEDASQVMLPVFVPLMAGYFVGQVAVFGDAESVPVRVLTIFPFTAPMLLPVRVARAAIAPWEVALSLGLLALGVWLLMRIAGRVYEFTLLQRGARIGWGQALRLSRGALR